MADSKNKKRAAAFAVILAALAAIPLNIGTIGAPLIIFLGKCIAFALAAIGLDLIWGYAGILSLGQGLYFSLGGYAMAMSLKLIATNGQITEFMHTGGLKTLPIVWRPFLSMPLSLFLTAAAPASLALIFGYFIFKSRVKGVYFSIISQALTWAAYSAFIALSPITNGNVGITGIKPAFGTIRGSMGQPALFKLYYTALIALSIAYAISARLAQSKFGKILIAMRDGENRAYFTGYNVASYKTFAYALSAAYAGVAGAIFANFNGGISPEQMTVAFSVNMAIWVAVGGRGTLIGAVIGAFIVNLGEYALSSGSMAELWQYFIGLAFTLSVLFFKGGAIGIFETQIPSLLKKLGGRGKDAFKRRRAQS